MGNSRFIIVNKVFTLASLLNGTGGGSIPARDETSPYLMENAMTAGRRTKWQTSSGVASPFTFDVDMGSATSINCAAVCGIRCDAGMGSCDIQYSTTYYPTATTWTTADSISLISTPRDGGVVFAGGAVSKRYWRFNITSFGQFSLSSLWLGSYTDLGGMHSPDAETTPFGNRAESQHTDGSFLVNVLGEKGHDFTLPFNATDSTLKTTLQSLSDVEGSVVYIDPDDNFYEVIVRGARVPTKRSHSSIYGVNVELARLP